MTKVKLTREVAEAIEEMRNAGKTNYSILRQAEGAVVTTSYLTLRRWAFDTGGAGSPDLLMAALTNGYEIEKTPEDAVREYYEKARATRRYSGYGQSFTEGRVVGVQHTLDLLGIKIGGINA